MVDEMEKGIYLALVAWVLVWFVKYFVVEYTNFRLYMKSIVYFGGITEASADKWWFEISMTAVYALFTFVYTPVALIKNHMYMFVKNDPDDIVRAAHDDVIKSEHK